MHLKKRNKEKETEKDVRPQVTKMVVMLTLTTTTTGESDDHQKRVIKCQQQQQRGGCMQNTLLLQINQIKRCFVMYIAEYTDAAKRQMNGKFVNCKLKRCRPLLLKS